jgi:plastocyanin
MSRRFVISLVCTLIAATSPSAGASEIKTERGVVAGTIRSSIPGIQPDGVGPIIVYLTPLDAAIQIAPREEVVTISQRDATFKPTFCVVSVGQPVELPNDDRIFHSVFSSSRPNEFKFSPYPQGESRTVRFEHPGPVRLYCSIHEKMSATIFVTPTPLHATTRLGGQFRIPAVPSGRYRLTLWASRLPGVSREVEVEGGHVTSADLEIGQAHPAPLVQRPPE